MAADPPRLLDKRAGRNYTTDPAMAMFREPEAVPEDVQERYSDEARRRFADSRADELFTREARSRAVRLRNAQNEAAGGPRHFHGGPPADRAGVAFTALTI